jgi:hypothetical protein
MSVKRDARRLDRAPVIYPDMHIAPQHPEIWIRLAGRWRSAKICHWERDSSGWRAWVKREISGGARPHRYEMYAYDGETIVPKYDETRPS